MGAGTGEKPLWTCPKCGVKLITPNLWHSCGLATLDEWKASLERNPPTDTR